MSIEGVGRAGTLLALAVILGASRGTAEEFTTLYGPTRVKGYHAVMAGPFGYNSLQFDHPGWVRGVTTYILDSEKRRMKDYSRLCHNVWFLPIAKMKALRFAKGITMQEGFTRIAFPKGFGIRVSTGIFHEVGYQYQSKDEDLDTEHYIEMVWQFQKEGEGRPLKDLNIRLVRILHEGVLPSNKMNPVTMEDAVQYPTMWWVPPGRHEYASTFTVAEDVRVHYMIAHLHRGAESISVMDATTGKTLYRGTTRHASDGRLSRLPSYSSREGFPLRKGRPYRFLAVYSNKTEKPIDAMAVLKIFFHNSG